MWDPMAVTPGSASMGGTHPAPRAGDLMGEPSPLPGGEPAPPSSLQPLPSLLYSAVPSWEQKPSPPPAGQAGRGHSLTDTAHLI